MDIKDILDSLGLDLTNPEAKRGAIEAVQAILNSRTPPPNLSGGSGGGGTSSEDVDVEIDPDLIQPSQKFNQPNTDDDIEINDEEDILSQVKHNTSEDDLNDEGNSDGDDSTDNNFDKSTSETDSSDTNGGLADDISSTTDEVNSHSENTENSDETDDPSEVADENSNNKLETASDDSDNADDNDEIKTPDEADSDNSDENKDFKNEDSGEADEFDEYNSENNESDSEETRTKEDENEFDEEDFLDDELKNIYDDQEVKSKREARKIKRERTLAAAKTALDKAKAKNVSQSLIRELEKSIEALESLTEAKAKSLSDISDEEFNLMINRVFDAISAVGDNDLTFTSDEDRKLKTQEIKADLNSRETQQELSDEDITAIRAETQAVKAREKEAAIYRKPAASSFKGFQEFLNSLYRAIALQVQTNEVQDDTWSAINRRYSGTGVLKQGQRKNDLPNRKIPVIDFYFDCSGSWGPADIDVGKRAVNALVDMEEKGQIKINIYYFSNHVFNDMQSALNEGGTRAWNDIVKNVITTQATNVIIMTDSDMEDWWEGKDDGVPALKYTVPGYVWYLWRNGSNAPRLPRDLKGRGGVQQFSFNRGDV